MEFKNRTKEVSEIRDILKSKDFEFLILYGRRRIGKTELALHTTKEKKRVYYLATGANNLERFYNVCCDYDSRILNYKKDYKVLLDYLKDKANVVIIDEFQELIKEDKNVLNIFQSIIDSILKNSEMKLIILGSSVSIITSRVLSYQSPLYGRRTGSIKLKPVSFFDLKHFFPKLDIKQLIEIFGFADGIPYYLIKIKNDLWTFLDNEIILERSFLKDEVDFLMRYEFDDPSTYKLILEAIANGKTKLNEIKNFIKVERTDLSPYIKNLIEVDLIKREVPITENIKSRSGRYYLNDNFLRFWFRFIYPNLSGIESNIFKINSIKSKYSEYLGLVFEDIAKEFLIKKNIFGITNIGRWWYKDNEIDIVGMNEKKEIFFGECKWKDKINADKVIKKLIEKAKKVEWNNSDRKEKYIIFAKSFIEKIKKFDGKEIICYDLKDIENVNTQP